MNKFSFLSALLYRPWAIDIDHAWSSGALVQSLLNPNFEFSEASEPEANKPYLIAAQKGALNPTGNDVNSVPVTISVIPITGELMKYDQLCGPAGMETIGQRIQEADQNHAIDAIMLVFDTPGGSVDGTQTLANIIKNTQKPIVSFINGLCASAGVWLATGANKVIASTNMDQIGSIGVMTSFADMQPYWEAQGIKFHEVYSSLSKDKNRLFAEMRNGDYANYIKDVLDPLATEFRNTVKQNRKGISADQLTGKMFFAKDVIGSLVDQIASFEEALQITADLVQTNSNSKTKSINMKNLTLLMAVLAVSGMESTEDGVFLSEEQLEAVEAQLQGHADALAAINAEKEEAITAAAQRLQEQEELAHENQRLTELVATLKKQPAEKSAVAVTNSNSVKTEADVNVSSNSDDFLTSLQKVKETYL